MRGAIAMINRVIFVAVVLCIAMIGQAVAEIVDGNKLFADCRDGDDPSARDRATKWGTCFGYASGVADALVPAGLYCTSSGATAGDVVDVVKLYLQNHPEKRHLSAPQLIVNALKDRYPCN
jgi:hypothetical protein